jgi:hypothetical protein
VWLTGLALWVIWQAVLMVPGPEAMALDPLLGFAKLCAWLLGVAVSDD